MYYLDFHELYRATTLVERRAVRRELDRDAIMELRLKHQRGICFYSADAIDMTAHLDHVIPVYYGGSNKLTNLVAACRDCNMIKQTGQIEITNPYTIKDYLRRQAAYQKYQQKLKVASPADRRRLQRYQPKHVKFYGLYRADLFKEIRDRHYIRVID